MLCQFLAAEDYYLAEHQVEVTTAFLFGVPGLDYRLVCMILCWYNGTGEVNIALGVPLQNCLKVSFQPGIL